MRIPPRARHRAGADVQRDNPTPARAHARFNTDGGGGVGHSARAKFDIPGGSAPMATPRRRGSTSETTRRADEDATTKTTSRRNLLPRKKKKKTRRRPTTAAAVRLRARGREPVRVLRGPRREPATRASPRVPAADRAALSVVRGARRGSNLRVPSPRRRRRAHRRAAFPEDIPEEEFRRTYSGANRLAVVGSDGLCRVLDVSDWSLPGFKVWVPERVRRVGRGGVRGAGGWWRRAGRATRSRCTTSRRGACGTGARGTPAGSAPSPWTTRRRPPGGR